MSRFDTHPIEGRHGLADDPATLPLHVLLAIPDYVSAVPGAPVFNVVGAATRLLGRFGWERATKILRPHVWAPAWTDEDILRFATSPFLDRRELFEGLPATRLGAKGFPGLGSLADPGGSGHPAYDVVHVVAAARWKDGERALHLSERQDAWLRAEALSEALRVARTRLVIVQVPPPEAEVAREIARVVARGGQAVLVVSCAEPSPVQGYLMDVYADIVHNRPLEEAVAPGAWLDASSPGLDVDLFAPDGSTDVLRFEAWLGSVQERADELIRTVEEHARQLESTGETLRIDSNTYLRRGEATAAARTLDALEGRLAEMRRHAGEMTGALRADLDWAHESGGVEPLSRIVEIVDDLEAEAREASRLYPDVEAELRSGIDRGPRVLNANFADPGTRRVLDRMEGLVAGETYELLVDVGPRWNTIPTIVRGHDEFPSEALPPGESGHLIEAVLVSDDFEPATVTGSLWLPQPRGRSHPWRSGQREPQSGPIALQITAPRIADQQARSRAAHGRLFLYYRNNLLQSALVTAQVVREPGAVDGRANEVRVDYAVTGAFRDVATQFETRELALSDNDAVRRHEVRLNIALNDGGAGTHRILVRHRDDVAPVWTAYDPTAAIPSLREARSTLLACFCRRDDAGAMLRSDGNQCLPALDSENGKTRSQFLFDLFFLAKIGNRLYNELVSQLRTASGQEDAIAWERELRRRLDTAGVIQVSRVDATPTQYAFPWALLYEYPMPASSETWTWCHVLKEEWSEDGRRDRPLASACPYKDEPWHAENVLCPYGFWGLKHVIEQPLAVVGALREGTIPDAAKRISVAGPIRLSVGWTRDAALDLAEIDEHVQHLSSMPGVQLAGPPPNPADDRESVRAVLSSSNLAYFLCHCEDDPAQNQPYLSVGPRDGSESGKIYASTVTDWARTTTLEPWAESRPLVFINGCHTGDLQPGEVLSFVSAFGLARAAGIVGTEVSVQLPVATETAERFLGKMVAREGGRLGQAMREVRWELANKGNLLGLCYSAYGLSDVRFVRA